MGSGSATAAAAAAAAASRVPPGFRFHPTDEELVNYYLRKKVKMEGFDLDVIRDVDLNKLEPWDLHERCRIDASQQTDWYFFSHKDKKYPTGTRTNRATAAGFWKATGRDKAVHGPAPRRARIGMRKTLVFYRGRAPHGQKTDWIMHEYRLLDDDGDCQLMQLDDLDPHSTSSYPSSSSNTEDCWVVCRVFKKRIHHQKSTGQQPNPSKVTILASEEEQSSLISDNQSIDQAYHNFHQVQSMAAHSAAIESSTLPHKALFCKIEEDYCENAILPKAPPPSSSSSSFLHLPQLESPKADAGHHDSSFLDADYYCHRRSLSATEPPSAFARRSDIFPSSLPMMDMPMLDASGYTKSLIFDGDESLADTDHWGVLDGLPNSDPAPRPYHIPAADLCTTAFPPNACDADIWKALL